MSYLIGRSGKQTRAGAIFEPGTPSSSSVSTPSRNNQSNKSQSITPQKAQKMPQGGAELFLGGMSTPDKNNGMKSFDVVNRRQENGSQPKTH